MLESGLRFVLAAGAKEPRPGSGRTMDDFPEFMNCPTNRIAASRQIAADVEGHVFDGTDGSPMAFWTCRETARSAPHMHDGEEYMICSRGVLHAYCRWPTRSNQC